MEILSRGISNSEGAFSLMQKSRGGIGGKSINQGTRHAMRQKEEDAPCRGGKWGENCDAVEEGTYRQDIQIFQLSKTRFLTIILCNRNEETKPIKTINDSPANATLHCK